MSDIENCNHPEVIKEDWYKVCTDCGLTWSPPFFDRPAIVVRQSRVRSISSKYSRVSNFELHLKQLKGEMTLSDPLFESLVCLKKDLKGKEVSYRSIKAYLKSNKMNKLYPYIPTLMRRFWGLNILELDESDERELVLRFLNFERAFEKVDKGPRKNSISYEFLIGQFLQERGHPDWKNIPTLSDKKKLVEVQNLYSQVVVLEN